MKGRSVLLGVFALSAAFNAETVQANASDVVLDIELPRLNVAEYHKPYVGIWIENSRRQSTQVAVWYDVGMANQEGQEWLKDMRQWWRRGGRSLSLPVDGLSGATQGPGAHSIETQLNDAIEALEPGEYTLRVEASREVGGRELLEVAFRVPINESQLPITAEGSSEINHITLRAAR